MSDPLTNIFNWLTGQVKNLALLFVMFTSVWFILRHEYTRLITFLIVASVVLMVIYNPQVLVHAGEFIAHILGL